jgi:hypothetical protein
VQQLLLGFVAVFPDRLDQRTVRRSLTDDPFNERVTHQREQSRSGMGPVALGIPGEVVPQVLRGTPALGKPETRENHPGATPPKTVDELLPKQADSGRVEQNDARPAEADHAALRLETEDFIEMKVNGFHLDLILSI